MKELKENAEFLIWALDQAGRANGYKSWPKILEVITLIESLNEEPPKNG